MAEDIYAEAREAADEMAAEYGLDGTLYKPSFTTDAGGSVTSVSRAEHPMRYVPNGSTMTVDEMGTQRQAARFLVFSTGLFVILDARDELDAGGRRYIVLSAIADPAGATWDVAASAV